MTYNKYKAKKTVINGITFDSKKEARRYSELKLLERAGKIKDLQLQPEFILLESFKNGDDKTVRSMKYIGDFKYTDEHGNTTIEDTKGVKTEAYRLKKKLFEKKYFPLTIKEI